MSCATVGFVVAGVGVGAVVAVVDVVALVAVVVVVGQGRRVVDGVEYGDVRGLSGVGIVARAECDMGVVGGFQGRIFVESDPDKNWVR